MIFSFLKYIQSSWYLNYKPEEKIFFFPTLDQIKSEGAKVDLDYGFKSEAAQVRDLSYRVYRGGYIASKTQLKEGIDIWNNEKIPIVDEYRFIKKNFNAARWIYIYIIRLFTFKNPIRETIAFLKTAKVKRKRLEFDLVERSDYAAFKSSLLEEAPLVSVIIPTLNRYEYLGDVLKDLEKQDYPNFEVLVLDQSEPFHKDFYKNYKLDLRVIEQKEKALWLARNNGIKGAKGDYIALTEDDVRIDFDWISQHAKCLDYFDVEISNGPFYPMDTKNEDKEKNFVVSHQFATGNVLFRKKIMKGIGMFDRQFEKQRMGDGEFGFRAYLQGLYGIRNPFASCIDVKAPSGGLRQLGSWDAFRPTSMFAPRPIPSVLYYFRRYFGTRISILALFDAIPPSIIPYKFKRNKFLRLLSLPLSIFILPLILFQVIKSWRMATKMIKSGPKIGQL